MGVYDWSRKAIRGSGHGQFRLGSAEAAWTCFTDRGIVIRKKEISPSEFFITRALGEGFAWLS